MIIEIDVHVYRFPSFRGLRKHIRTVEDAIASRTPCTKLYRCNDTEKPVDNTEDVVADMDRSGVDFALVRARAGFVSDDLVAAAAKRHPKRMVALAACATIRRRRDIMRIRGRRPRLRPPTSIVLGALGMKEVGETFVRALTDHTNLEKIAKDLSGIMRVVERFSRRWGAASRATSTML